MNTFVGNKKGFSEPVLVKIYDNKSGKVTPSGWQTKAINLMSYFINIIIKNSKSKISLFIQLLSTKIKDLNF